MTEEFKERDLQMSQLSNIVSRVTNSGVDSKTPVSGGDKSSDEEGVTVRIGPRVIS